MAAPGGLVSSVFTQQHRDSVSSPSGAPVAPAGPTGDTAQTAGFVQPSASGFAPSGGGLQSSPNVPIPGTSINPETGKPHTAGLTRAELQAIRAKGADLLDPTPQNQAVRRGSSPPTSTAPQFGVLGGVSGGNSPEKRRASELSGKEQAARQLSTTEPGPGTSPTSTIYEDVTQTLDKVGRTALNVLPNSVKEVQRRLSNAGSTSPTSPTGSNRRNSVLMFLDKVKTDAEKIASQAKSNLATVDRRPSEVIQAEKESGLLAQVKNLWNDASPAGSTAVTTATSLPTHETLGAQPGDRSSGAGPLPGTVHETGVAILPDEKNAVASSSGTTTAARSLPSQENQGMMPGEVSAGAGALPGRSTEAGVAIPPDVRKEEGSAGGLVEGAAVGGAAVAAGAALAGGHHESLAPALPHTNLGQGAAQGATDLSGSATATSSAPGSKASSLMPETRHANERTTSMASITAIHQGTEGQRSSDEKHSSPLAASSVTANDVSNAAAPVEKDTHAPSVAPTSAETHSAALAGAVATGAAAAGAATVAATHEQQATAPTSTTAGSTGASHEAAAPAAHQTHAPAAAPITEQTHIDKKNPTIGDNADSATGTPSSTLTKSLSPGEVHNSVGHPATRDQEGTSREPGKYPAPDYGGKAESPKEAAKAEHRGEHRGSLDTATASTAVDSNGTNASRRKSSSASSGGKKVGFMKKLKGEMKVLGGKLTHDEEKVQQGEKIKHGEE